VVARPVRTKAQSARKEQTLSFFDEGDEPRSAIRSPKPPPRRPAARSRRGTPDDRTLLFRRAGAAALVLVVLIALVLIVKTILNHQAIDGLKSYNTEVAGIVDDELVNVQPFFFHDLDGAFTSSDPAEVPTNLQQLVSTEEGYYRQAEAWSVPAQMVGAQRDFVEALGFRYQALQGIEGLMTKAIASTSDQSGAIKLIAGEMENLLTADTIYAERVKPLIQQALANAGITGETTPDSVFLPDIGWLVPATVAQRIIGDVPSSLGGNPAPGSSPGHALEGVSVESATGSTTTALTTTGINTLPYTPAGITFVLNVLNSGNVPVYGVDTEIEFSKAGLSTSCLRSTAQISKTVPGSTYNSSIVFAPSTCPDLTEFFNVVLKMKAGVVPVRGENDSANNYQTYLVEFTRS
jgi:hypothetical protein